MTSTPVSHHCRAGRETRGRRWDEGVKVTVQLLLAACVMVVLARHVLGCPSGGPDRALREPRAASRVERSDPAATR